MDIAHGHMTTQTLLLYLAMNVELIRNIGEELHYCLGFKELSKDFIAFSSSRSFSSIS